MSLLILNQTAKRNPYWNLSIEEAICLLFTEYKKLSGVIRFWQNPLTVVMGLSESVHNVLYKDKIEDFKKNFSQFCCRKYPTKHLYIARRASGGGCVLHNFGSNLNFSFFVSVKKYPEFFPIKKSYEIILNFVISALNNQDISTNMMGQSDISDKTFKKISGNSQFRKKNCLVHHGTLILSKKLIDFIPKYQKHPPKEPDYRKKRSHGKFLTFLPKNFSLNQFKVDLIQEFKKYLNIDNTQISNLYFMKSVMRKANELLKNKYTNLNYILGEHL